MSQQRVPNNRKQLWRDYAHSQQEYENKIREKEINELKLSPHEDLLSFFLLKKSCDKTINMSDEQFNTIPDKYIKDIRNDIGCSLPPNFEDNARKGPPSAEALSNDISLLASLLGGYNPPRTCQIQRLDRETLVFPNNLPPKLPPKQAQPKQSQPNKISKQHLHFMSQSKPLDKHMK
eukprot:275638_1